MGSTFKSENNTRNSSNKFHKNPSKAKKTASVGTEPSKKDQEAAEAGMNFQEVTCNEKRQLIAEAAYYRAERRSFIPGNELADWLDAETEIEKMLSRLD